MTRPKLRGWRLLQEGFFILLALVALAVLFASLFIATTALAGVQELRKAQEALRQSLLDLRRRLDGPPPQPSLRQAPDPRPAAAPAAPPKLEPSTLAPPPGPAPPSHAPPSIQTVPAAFPALPAAPGAPAPPAPAASAARPSMEESLGVQVPVWIGSVALSLAGVYLVKYSFDKGLLTPAIRLAIGASFGAVLLAGGEWLRSRSAWVLEPRPGGPEPSGASPSKAREHRPLRPLQQPGREGVMPRRLRPSGRSRFRRACR